MLEFLPPRLLSALRHVNCNLLYELRVRADKPLRANFNGKFVWLGDCGFCEEKSALVPTQAERCSRRANILFMPWKTNCGAGL